MPDSHLLTSFLWRGHHAGGKSVELMIDAGPDATVGEVGVAVAELLGSTRPVHHGSGQALNPGDLRSARVLSAESFGTGETPGWFVHVAAGPDAGHRVPLNAEGLTVGRGAVASGLNPNVLTLDDPSVSESHVHILPSGDSTGCLVIDLGSTNATVVEGVALVPHQAVLVPAGTEIRIGATVVAIIDDRAPTDRAVPGKQGADGSAAFHRPPRTKLPTTRTEISVPAARPEARREVRLGVTALMAPLAIGLVLAVLINPRMALLALSSPILLLGNWLEDKRRTKQRCAEGTQSLAVEMAIFESAIICAHNTMTIGLKARTPDPAQLRRRAELPTMNLWERRRDHGDWMQLSVGRGTVAPVYPLGEPRGDRAVGVQAILDAQGPLEDVPVTVSLLGATVVGLCGTRTVTTGIARSLVAQACALHGPSDLSLAVVADATTASAWAWTSWLPHIGDLHHPQQLMVGEWADEFAATVLSDVDTTRGPGRPFWLVVVDAVSALNRRDGALRDLVANPPSHVCVLVLGPRMDRLPTGSSAVIAVQTPQRVTVLDVTTGKRADSVIPTAMSATQAQHLATQLHRWSDIACSDTASLADQITLAELVGGNAPPFTVEATLDRWAHSTTTSMAVPVAVSAAGPVHIDLRADGPHGLVAGTTGSGKSELLRTLVASLAAHHPPTTVTFVLVDYKGGAAFAGLSLLPHTVGMVTDLDAGLGRRALVCLEAELRHRERILAAHGVGDIVEYHGTEALPRLLVVIDEFATLAAELPDFLSALVGVAQRGRSLGVHLLLATQRPAGAVSESIRANTNMRIALRVQDTADSMDVVGTQAAATLDRHRPGRALMRTGPGELALIQTATVAASPSTSIGLRVRRLGFGAPETTAAPQSDSDADTDLMQIVASATLAAQQLQLASARRPWPDPLPNRMLRSDPGGAELGIGLVDLPDEQRQEPMTLSSDAENVLILGSAGSGTTSALITCALTICERSGPNDLHLYAIDFGTQLLSPLAKLPHTGALIGPAEPGRLERLLKHLQREVERRRTLAATGLDPCDQQVAPRIVILVESWGGLRSAHDDLTGHMFMERFHRVLADGPGLGISAIVTADRPQALPSAAMAAFGRRFVLRLGDPVDYAVMGLRRPERAVPSPGRGVDVERGCEFQMAHEPDVGAAVNRVLIAHLPVDLSTPNRRPTAMSTLSARITLTHLEEMLRGSNAPAAAHPETLAIVLGLGDDEHQPIGWALGEGEHALITGPSRSGKSTALIVAHHMATAALPHARVHVLTPRTSAMRLLPGCDHHRDLASVAAAVSVADGPCLVFIDDAELVDDSTSALAALLACRRPGFWLVAAGRADALRTNYSHWSTTIRRSRHGLALRPQMEIDGELWLTPLPRRTMALSPTQVGRGYLVTAGSSELIQVGDPSSYEPDLPILPR